MDMRKGQPGKQHLVFRCPGCGRPVWQRRLLALLGLDPSAPAVPSEVAFLAQTTRGKGGWKAAATIRDAATLRAQSVEALSQAQRFARRCFERLWLTGLLSPSDVQAVLGTTSMPVEQRERGVSFAPYGVPSPGTVAPPPQVTPAVTFETWRQ